MDIAKIKELMKRGVSLMKCPTLGDKGVAPNVVTYSTLIGGFCRVERPRTTLDLFHKMQACGQLPDPQTYAILLDGLCKNKKIGEALALFQEMEDKKLDHNIVFYNILIDNMCNARELTTAREIFNGLLAKGL